MIEYFIVHRIRNKILTIHLAFKRKFQKCLETMENGNKGFLINKNKIFLQAYFEYNTDYTTYCICKFNLKKRFAIFL